MVKKVIYFTQRWDTNIGNLFIDIGALHSLYRVAGEVRKAGEELYIQPVGTLNLWSNWLFLNRKISILKYIAKPFLKWELFKKYSEKCRSSIVASPNINRLNLAEIIQADYAVLSGCILTPLHFQTFDKLLKLLKRRNIDIIFYGVGGETYSDYEVKMVRKKLKEIRPRFILTRDTTAYELYSDLAEDSFDGLDASFYVNNIVNTVMTKSSNSTVDINPFVVLTFDNPANTRIERFLEKDFREKGFKVVTCSHIPYSKPSEKFISESPFDYLLLYSQAEEVHSDRVHACVATLSFGGRCRLYNKTPRANLLLKACIGDITESVCPSSDNLNQLKKKQIDTLFQILAN